MSTQDHVNKDPKLAEDKDPKKAQHESEKGDGYVPPTPEVPSAQNSREHNGPITNKNPGGRRE
ncbi:hypothetical protein [Sphingobacterium corticibacter]|uniref:Uncharacterized protein n=1 Tax=Sphingobacterium corticibacter TaxID=2171749 RepID=A0A2T8HHX6_9SPHI|nr:hypothetical protein [Sphingobacterium corticibacter]PVH25047.1 hypothetical protein DC487_08920 [Sphingobacterium corticibacter]